MPARGLPAGQRGRLVGANVGFEEEPDWSPDSRRLVFRRTTASAGFDRRLGLSVVDADGSNEHRITSGDGYRNPVWSPDGTRIAFEFSNGTPATDLYVINADGSGTPTRIDGFGFDLDWQPLPAANPCTITGTPGPDVLRGTAGPDVICGLGGGGRCHPLRRRERHDPRRGR